MGTSGVGKIGKQHEQDHPHACGDKKKYGGYDLDTTGSSPRVWGQEYVPKNNFYPNRIIPTRVGTRPFRATSMSWTQDHPHACGDKLT